MNLTKLVERIPHEWSASNAVTPPRHLQWCLRCAFDAALAAVPQDTVEAVLHEAKQHVYARCEYDDSLAPLTWDDEAAKAGLCSVLAARPVRAVLTEEQVDRAMEEAMEPSGIACQECGDDGLILNPKLFTAALNAALDRQHAEPPATDTQHWPGCPRKGGIGECDCTGDFSGAEPPEDAAVEEAKRRLLRECAHEGIPECYWADIRLVCGAKP